MHRTRQDEELGLSLAEIFGEAIFSGTIEMFERQSVFTVLLIEQPCEEVVNAVCRYDHHARTNYAGAS